MRIFRPLSLGLLVGLLLHLPVSVAIADGGHGGAGQRQSAPSPPSPSPSAGLLKSWNGLVAARDAISDDVDHGRTKSLQANAALVPALAQALVEQSEGLSDSKRSRVRSGATQLSKVSEHLRKTSDTGNRALIQSDLKRITRALRLISSQYPDGSLALDGHTTAGRSRSGGHHN